MENTNKNAQRAMKQILKLMNLRLKSAAAAETAEPEKAAKIIKNDELIKFAGFVLSLYEKESETKPVADEREEIKFVLDEQVKKWAQ